MQVGNDGLAHLKGCDNLQYLVLGNTQVSDAGLIHLTACKNLRGLNLSYTRVTNEGIAHLKHIKNLGSVDLDHTLVTDDGLPVLAECKSLNHLNLGATKVTRAGVTELAKALPGCRITGVGDEIPPTDSELHAALRVLNWRGAVKVNGSTTAITSAADLPNTPVRPWWVSGKKCRDLSAGDVALFKSCKELTHIDLSETGIGDGVWVHLQGIKSLVWLDMTKTKVTAVGVSGFAEAMPKCRIIWDGGTIEPRK
jgi:hypothetical protein